MGLECMGYRGWWGRLELQLTERPTCAQQRHRAGTSQLWVSASETSRWGSRKGRQVLKVEARRLCLDLLYHFRDCIHSIRVKITWSVINQGWGFGEERVRSHLCF